MPPERPSNCSAGVPVDFYWCECFGPDEDEHIEAAVNALWQAIRRRGERGWDPRAAALVRSEFRDRLREAARGELKPVDHVKEVGPGHPVLFEIRWQDIPVMELGTPRRFHDIQVRLIHAEPEVLGLAFVGLHAHEKIIIKDRGDREANEKATHRAQDAEIAKAAAIHGSGVGSLWGQVRRQP